MNLAVLHQCVTILDIVASHFTMQSHKSLRVGLRNRVFGLTMEDVEVLLSEVPARQQSQASTRSRRLAREDSVVASDLYLLCFVEATKTDRRLGARESERGAVIASDTRS